MRMVNNMVDMIINLISAIGTVGATVLALYLALQNNRQRIDCAFMWETATGDKPMLILNNIGNHTVIEEYVDLYFHNEKIGRFDILRSSSDTMYKLTAIVTTTTKKRYKSSYKYCYHELLGFTYSED